MTTGHTEDSLRQLLHEAADLPFGDAKEALLEDVLRHAEAAELPRVAFDTRMQLIVAYSAGLSRAKLFVPFARCLADYDRNPSEYEPWVSHLLLWSFKHAVGSMTRFPEIPLPQVFGALDDMERRYRAGGHSMHAVYMYHQRVAHHVGDLDAAEEWYRKWCAAPRDELSDCVGCEPTTKVFYLAATGRDAEAIDLAEPVLRERLTCREQPQAILTELLLSYARQGRAEQARTAHRRAYRVLRVLPQDMGSIGDHLVFCALTGNEARGLELLDRHLGWLDRAPSPFDGMTFAASVALLCNRVIAAGHGDMPISRPAHGDRPATEVPVAELRDEMAAYALAVAARFDARNGTTYQSRRMRETMAAEPVAEYIPLSTTPRRRPVPVAPHATAPVPDLSPEELADRAEEHLLRFEETAAEAVVARLEQLSGHDDVLTGRITALRARLADGDAAEAGLRKAAGLLAGDRRQSVLSRLGAQLCRSGRAEEGMPLLRESVAHFRDRGDDEHEAWASLRLMNALLLAGEHDEAVRLVERAAELAAKADDPLLTGAVSWARIDTSGDDVDVALGAAAAALAAYDEAD
ncbi:MAG TPA: tetratricopeptide repeat protein, partial [Pseudonocardiaceae bacterium]|nr:tetratricopeptide repeat protein [Pseudonocardiaceae bacterium]